MSWTHLVSFTLFLEALHLLYALAELRACLLPYMQHLHNPCQDFKHGACLMQSMPKKKTRCSKTASEHWLRR